MNELDVLAKANRINLLFDFYEPLLTDKQQTFLKYYFHDDYSLGEIASLFDISRQAVYEHIKRAEVALEEYETKLKLLQKHLALAASLDDLEQLFEQQVMDRSDRIRILTQLRSLGN